MTSHKGGGLILKALCHDIGSHEAGVVGVFLLAGCQ